MVKTTRTSGVIGLKSYFSTVQ
ncbi:BnaA04g17730D [Brassica napus]|uniref:BnaA04g17730D protein n=2 Tax=Brassica TaxID=3705 RepID=A0A078GWX6_BRANA|nr:BnaA04g17730D [Brassica napus]